MVVQTSAGVVGANVLKKPGLKTVVKNWFKINLHFLNDFLFI